MRKPSRRLIVRLRQITTLICLILPALAPSNLNAAEGPGMDLLLQALVSEDPEEQTRLLNELADHPGPEVQRVLTEWPRGGVFLHETADGSKIPFMWEDGTPDNAEEARGTAIATGELITDEAGEPVTYYVMDLFPIDTSADLRRVIRSTLDQFSLSDPNPNRRRDAALQIGIKRDPEVLAALERRLSRETEPQVQRALKIAIAMTGMVSEDPQTKIQSLEQLGELRAIASIDFLDDAIEEAEASDGEHAAAIKAAATESLVQIKNYVEVSDLMSTAFFGLSLSAVLLVAALGLAITFGLMGVINMAHGEVIMVGAYTAYVTQNLFAGWFGPDGPGFNYYFPTAILFSFCTGALLGIILERGVIRFLYKRPLESLLATWGVSLVLQQIVRATFGANNVQVTSPTWLTGNVTFHDVTFAYNRIFVIVFAVGVVFLTWVLLSKTSLGLQVRAVMQNRAMASCMGVRTDRVNMATFAFGSGLAGMAGACLSQIGNVGPSLGQSHIIDCFMVVVLGGVGNLVGTVFASLGIGVTDKILQPHFGAVMGKILVLGGIILFLQWRPSGLFAARGRSLD